MRFKSGLVKDDHHFMLYFSQNDINYQGWHLLGMKLCKFKILGTFAAATVLYTYLDEKKISIIVNCQKSSNEPEMTLMSSNEDVTRVKS